MRFRYNFISFPTISSIFNHLNLKNTTANDLISTIDKHFIILIGLTIIIKFLMLTLAD